MHAGLHHSQLHSAGPVKKSCALQVRTIQAWSDSVIVGEESAASERAVTALKDSGHAEAVRYCGPKKVCAA